jgi:hypothetical protein
MSMFAMIPLVARNALKTRLQAVKDKYITHDLMSSVRRLSISPNPNRMRRQTSMESIDDTVAARGEDASPSLEVRDAFLVFMAELLGRYHTFVVRPSRDLASNVYRSLNEEFSKDKYVNSSDSSKRTILRQICNTQMFASLIQQRHECRNPSLVFFEKAVEAYRTYRGSDIVPLHVLVDRMDGVLVDANANDGDGSNTSTSGERPRSAQTPEKSRRNRSELLKGRDLSLHRATTAPLIVPGPNAAALVTAQTVPSERWGVLDRNKLEMENEAACLRLKALEPLYRWHTIEVRTYGVGY